VAGLDGTDQQSTIIINPLRVIIHSTPKSQAFSLLCSHATHTGTSSSPSLAFLLGPHTAVAAEAGTGFPHPLPAGTILRKNLPSRNSSPHSYVFNEKLVSEKVTTHKY